LVPALALYCCWLSSQELVDAIEERGVELQTTTEVEAEFRRVGAPAEVIAALRANYRPPVFSSGSTTTVSRSESPAPSR